MAQVMGSNPIEAQGKKNTGVIARGKYNFALGQVKMEVWWSTRQVKLTLVVLLVINSNQNQFHNSRLQDKQNNELKARIKLKSTHTLLAFIVRLSASDILVEPSKN